MNQQSIDLTNALVVSLFRHSLFVTGLFWLTLIAMLLMIVVVVTKSILRFNLSPESLHEPRARTYLRWAFGSLWLVAGFLQFQPSMPLGLGNNVVAQMTSGTPSWLHSLMSQGINLWNMHPIALAVGVAWLQVGFGLALLVSKGRLGRFVGAASALWATLIWVIGNGAGGIFASGASILFGWPGATFFYVLAGVWLVVDYEVFKVHFSAYTLRLLSLVLLVAAVLQCLPSAQFWHGGNSNALTTMTSTMARIAQPHWLSWAVRHVGTIAGTMGGGFNIVVILWLLTCAVGLWMSVERRWNWPAWTLAAGCLIFWVAAEDTSLFGGLATDVNSLLPLGLVATCALPHWRGQGARVRRLPLELTNSAGAVVATFASAMILFAASSMGAATFANAETTFYVAHNGPASQTLAVAPTFTLTDQRGAAYSLGEHARHVTLLTFLDPQCFTDCPLLAQQLEHLRSQLSLNAKIDIVAIAADPYHEQLSNVRHFIATRGLSHVRNFYFLTGKLTAVRKVWNAYGIGVTMRPTDKMSVHSDFMFIINPRGKLRWIIPDVPLASTSGVASAVSELRGLLASQGVH